MFIFSTARNTCHSVFSAFATIPELRNGSYQLYCPELNAMSISFTQRFLIFHFAEIISITVFIIFSLK